MSQLPPSVTFAAVQLFLDGQVSSSAFRAVASCPAGTAFAQVTQRQIEVQEIMVHRGFSRNHLPHDGYRLRVAAAPPSEAGRQR